ncbi:MAG: hypothetical protein ACOC10_08540 [Bacteroidota bacterium]
MNKYCITKSRKIRSIPSTSRTLLSRATAAKDDPIAAVIRKPKAFICETVRFPGSRRVKITAKQAITATVDVRKMVCQELKNIFSMNFLPVNPLYTETAFIKVSF